MLGYDQPVILHLIDIPQAQKALSGVAMELGDCAFPLLHGIVCTDDLKTGKEGVTKVLLMSKLRCWLEPSREESDWREETFFRKMRKFSFLKERPSTTMPIETSELSLLETQPTPMP